jgi:glucosamine-6-phosphate deaminase
MLEPISKEFQSIMRSKKANQLQAGKLKVEIHPDGLAAGMAAAQATADAMKQLATDRESFSVIFATGASQLQMLGALTDLENLPWKQVRGFHMDEYVGLPADHPASFRRYLRERLTGKVPLHEFHEVNGSAADPEQAAREYSALIRAADAQLCLLGIGENGHLAFNDPAVADFSDPVDAKIVYLDEVCRRQQAAEGWFATVDGVPGAAITLTIPALFRVPRLIVSVPGPRKAAIVRRVMEEPISTDCPATILRTHPGATVYLDAESAAQLDGILVSH